MHQMGLRPLLYAKQVLCRPPLLSRVLSTKPPLGPPPRSKYAPQAPKASYPERLLIYHAGTGKTVFIGCLKVTTIFLFGFSCLVLAPAYAQSEEYSKWSIGAVILCGALPLLYTTYTTTPFVTYIHLYLPPVARTSHSHLRRYLAHLPRTAELDLTTMRASGRARVSRVAVEELCASEGARGGVANFVRVGPRQKRWWWRGRELDSFLVGEREGVVREKGVWEVVARRIRDG